MRRILETPDQKVQRLIDEAAQCVPTVIVPKATYSPDCCEKCGGYRYGSMLYPQPAQEKFEKEQDRLKITCGRCGFIWYEPARTRGDAST